MKNILRSIIYIVVLAGPGVTYSQGDELVGAWKGTSICQVKDSPCHDENVVFHITHVSGVNYLIKGNRIVDGKEVEMGDLDFVYDKAANTLTCIRDDRSHSVWKFDIKGSSMSGTLMTNGKTLYRIIKLQKG